MSLPAHADLEKLEQLTVPADRLARGCGLADPKPEPGKSGAWPVLPVSSNPWIGNDVPVVATIRERIDGPVMLTDGPPPDARGAARFRSRLADGVDAAYAAVYRSDDPELVIVYAVRFTAEQDAAAAPARTRPAPTPRFVSGKTVVVVSGEHSRCFPAIAAHVKSVLNR